ncbi:hypothetical protein IX57_06945 [Paracoccus sanguinis]|nr:hypothetical protein IX57_06945 [Paracoccus sanguinis]
MSLSTSARFYGSSRLKTLRKATALSVILASVLFRVIERYSPTARIDGVDNFLVEDENCDMRGMLNGGPNRMSA